MSSPQNNRQQDKNEKISIHDMASAGGQQQPDIPLASKTMAASFNDSMF
mgnify:CR=1 FL=1